MKSVDSVDEPDTLVGASASAGAGAGTSTDTTALAPREPGDDETHALDGYAIGEVIGRGGSGEVLVAHDLRVGREVAIKRLRAAHPSADEKKRFLREARIQARLDHPAIPPVHELGTDAAGRPYFTMKRLAGTTLAEELQRPAPDRARLLRAFADVCFAIELAHSRGVVHRDLKPSNVMLGDFGAVYVLDWGLARMVGEAVAEVVTDDIDSLDVEPAQLLGTPGYMAPEQLHKAAEAGRPADVYSLGAILFEILAGEPLHPRGATALQSTVGGHAVTSPGKRKPDRAIPPELDAACAAMLEMDPTARPTARRVAERIVAYLDGDRDVARRRTMAVDLVWNARAARDEGRRAEAMRAAGRALALDPESADAADLVTGLMLAPPVSPADLQPELQQAIGEHERASVQKHARTAILAYAALAAFLPIAIWNGVQRWDIVLGVFGLSVAMAAAAWRITRQPDRSLLWMLIYASGNLALLAMVARMAGPFTFVTGLSIVMVMSSMAYPKFLQRPLLLIGVIAAGLLLPIVGELTGLLSRTFEIRDGELINHANALAVGGRQTLVLLIGSSLAMLAIAGNHAARLYRNNRDAQRQLVIHAWHLEHLVPTPHVARRASTSTMPPPAPAGAATA
jgi:serine/threonine-protein kinase